MPTTATNYLDPASLAAISSLDIRARLIVEGLMTGLHRSPFQGFSVEFAQHRQYAPGDDIRHLDWKVFGRTDKLYLKQYQKETNLDLIVMVDVSGSMAYGSDDATRWRKYDHAASAAAVLTYLALQQQDRVGLVLFDHHIRAATRMSNSREHWRAVIDALNAHAPALNMPQEDRATDLARLFDEVLAKLTQRSIVVLISDLFDSPESFDRAMARLQHRRHDLMVLQTLDSAEINFPFRAPAEFFGLEAEGRLGIDPAALRRAYQQSFRDHQARLQETTRRYRFDHLVLNTSESLGPPLSHFLARRSANVSQGK